MKMMPREKGLISVDCHPPPLSCAFHPLGKDPALAFSFTFRDVLPLTNMNDVCLNLLCDIGKISLPPWVLLPTPYNERLDFICILCLQFL